MIEGWKDAGEKKEKRNWIFQGAVADCCTDCGRSDCKTVFTVEALCGYGTWLEIDIGQ